MAIGDFRSSMAIGEFRSCYTAIGDLRSSIRPQERSQVFYMAIGDQVLGLWPQETSGVLCGHCRYQFFYTAIGDLRFSSTVIGDLRSSICKNIWQSLQTFESSGLLYVIGVLQVFQVVTEDPRSSIRPQESLIFHTAIGKFKSSIKPQLFQTAIGDLKSPNTSIGYLRCFTRPQKTLGLIYDYMRPQVYYTELKSLYGCRTQVTMRLQNSSHYTATGDLRSFIPPQRAPGLLYSHMGTSGFLQSRIIPQVF